jgi:hypothetical protein
MMSFSRLSTYEHRIITQKQLFSPHARYESPEEQNERNKQEFKKTSGQQDKKE